MVDVVVELNGALLVANDPWGAAFQVVAHERLAGVAGIEVLEVAARLVGRARPLARRRVSDEGLHRHRILPVKLRGALRLKACQEEYKASPGDS